MNVTLPNQKQRILRRKLPAVDVKDGLPVVTQQLTVAIEEPTAKTYWMCARADQAYLIKRVTARTASGTCSAQMSVVEGSLGSAIACSTSENTAVTELVWPAGSFLKVTISSPVGLSDLAITLDYE